MSWMILFILFCYYLFYWVTQKHNRFYFIYEGDVLNEFFSQENEKHKLKLIFEEMIVQTTLFQSKVVSNLIHFLFVWHWYTHADFIWNFKLIKQKLRFLTPLLPCYENLTVFPRQYCISSQNLWTPLKRDAIFECPLTSPQLSINIPKFFPLKHWKSKVKFRNPNQKFYQIFRLKIKKRKKIIFQYFPRKVFLLLLFFLINLII